MSLIKIENLKKKFNDQIVLNGINLSINAGDSLAILGKSGAGKSVLIKTIIGLIKLDEGNILFKEQKNNASLITKSGFLFQNAALFDSLTVLENITFLINQQSKLTKAQKEEITESKLKLVGLQRNVMYKYPSELSGGMQKRVALARTICSNPEIIFYDEPTTGLDPIMSSVINDLINNINQSLKSTSIIITHSINTAISTSSHIALLDEGQIKWYGSTEKAKSTKDPYMLQFMSGKINGPMKIG